MLETVEMLLKPRGRNDDSLCICCLSYSYGSLFDVTRVPIHVLIRGLGTVPGKSIW